jgi:hypothetical protein
MDGHVDAKRGTMASTGVKTLETMFPIMVTDEPLPSPRKNNLTTLPVKVAAKKPSKKVVNAAGVPRSALVG